MKDKWHDSGLEEKPQVVEPGKGAVMATAKAGSVTSKFDPNKFYSWPTVRTILREEVKKQIEYFCAHRLTFTTPQLLTERGEKYIERMLPEDIEKLGDVKREVWVVVSNTAAAKAYKDRLWRAVEENTLQSYRKGQSVLIYTSKEPAEFPPPRGYVFIPFCTKRADIGNAVAEELKKNKTLRIYKDPDVMNVNPEDLPQDEVRPQLKEKPPVFVEEEKVTLDGRLTIDYHAITKTLASGMEGMAQTNQQLLGMLADVSNALTLVPREEVAKPEPEEKTEAGEEKKAVSFHLAFDNQLKPGEFKVEGEELKVSSVTNLARLFKENGWKVVIEEQ